MALWMIRAGRSGEREDLNAEKGVATTGWIGLSDLSSIEKRYELARLLRETYPDEKPRTLTNWESQLWPVIGVMREGDLVVVPLKSRRAVAIGKITGPYEYHPDFPDACQHTRPVEWLGAFPRDTFGQDLLYSMGASMTICRISRNDAEERVRAIAEGKGDHPLKGPPPLP